MRVWTIGFTKKSAKEFFVLLRESGAVRIVDVRLNPGSQLAGFAKKGGEDLTWFAHELSGVDYVHVPSLAPTKELLQEYRKKQISWEDYEARFIDLMKSRRIESTLRRETISDGCLLCSEKEPHQCHRRLVAEYLDEHWGKLEIEHLGVKRTASSEAPPENRIDRQFAEGS